MLKGTRPRIAGIVLCGGQSLRMGRSKALLAFGTETMLQRVTRLLAVAVDTIVVVAASRQRLPPLPPEAHVVRDRYRGQGPLEGIATGLAALDQDVEAVYITGCDVPLLAPAFVSRVVSLLGEHDCAVPRSDGIEQPLAAAYRPRVRAQVDALLTQNNRSVRALFSRVRTRFIDVEDLKAVDPQLLSLRNCNTPADYRAALVAAKLR
jgi:molybdopterin-guanine dinucleotide biosynthesis protein A